MWLSIIYSFSGQKLVYEICSKIPRNCIILPSIMRYSFFQECEAEDLGYTRQAGGICEGEMSDRHLLSNSVVGQTVLMKDMTAPEAEHLTELLEGVNILFNLIYRYLISSIHSGSNFYSIYWRILIRSSYRCLLVEKWRSLLIARLSWWVFFITSLSTYSETMQWIRSFFKF